jgi:hypothetical protein
MSLTKLDEQRLKVLTSYLSDLQAFVDLNITGNVRMTTKVIFEKFSEDNEIDMSEEDFIPAFRAAVREGKITGLANAYKWGYQSDKYNCAITGVETEEGSDRDLVIDSDSSDSDDGLEIYFEPNIRLRKIDGLNWAIQKKKGNTWINKSYYSKLDNALHGIAHSMIDNSLKLSNIKVTDLEKLVELIESAREDVLKHLEKIVETYNKKKAA